jgi:hypothetical protein
MPLFLLCCSSLKSVVDPSVLDLSNVGLKIIGNVSHTSIVESVLEKVCEPIFERSVEVIHNADTELAAELAAELATVLESVPNTRDIELKVDESRQSQLSEYLFEPIVEPLHNVFDETHVFNAALLISEPSVEAPSSAEAPSVEVPASVEDAEVAEINTPK